MENNFNFWSNESIMNALTKITILPIFIFFASCSSDSVYVCKSPDAYAYHHDEDCEGLRNCSYEVISVSKDEAISSYNRDLCGYED
jgi:hypothetical protein